MGSCYVYNCIRKTREFDFEITKGEHILLKNGKHKSKTIYNRFCSKNIECL